MSKYRDRYGKLINVGDVVVTAIAMNHDNYRGFSFVTRIVRRAADGKTLLADGSWTTTRLRDVPRKQIVKLTEDVDLRNVEACFIREFGAKHN